MSSKELEDYVFAHFIGGHARNFTPDNKYLRREDFVIAIQNLLMQSTEPFGKGVHGSYPDVASRFVDSLLECQALSTVSDEFAGDFHQFNSPIYKVLINDLQGSNTILVKASEIGSVFWDSAFASLGGDPARSAVPGSDLIPVPASDRIVSLDDNSRAEIEPSVDEIIDLVDRQNGEPGILDIQRRISGQLKAGRELLRAGNFKAYALYVTLVSGLIELVNRYREHAIGAAASELLLALAKYVFEIEL